MDYIEGYKISSKNENGERKSVTITLSKEFYDSFWDRLDYYLKRNDSSRSELIEKLLREFVQEHKEKIESIPR